MLSLTSMVSQRNRLLVRFSTFLLFIIILSPVFLACKSDTQKSFSGTTNAPGDLVKLTDTHQWPNDLFGRSVVQYPNVRPQLGEEDSISLSWWHHRNIAQSRYLLDIYVFDTEATATGKFKALERERFRTALPILFFFTRPLDVFVPEVLDVHSPATTQERIGCVTHQWDAPFVRCDYIAQYEHTVIDVTVIIDDTDNTKPPLKAFEDLVQSSQALLEFHMNLR